MSDERMRRAEEKFSQLLKRIFQLDCADLDFGIYRILAMRREGLETYLDQELLPQVRETLAAAAGDRGAVADELAALEETYRSTGMTDAEIRESRPWRQLQEKLDAAPDVASLARQVFSDLTTFFSRYYDAGDFMALPRYKGDTYAIPYDGSEVKLHWANADQYYIKTSEHHADYTARLEGAVGLEAPTLRFHLTAAESDRDNNKASDQRRYVLSTDAPVTLDGGELTVRFAYRVPTPSAGRQPTQKSICESAEATILSGLPADWQQVLTRRSSQNPARFTVLGYQLYRYTKKSTSDYFIHKDLGGFLARELDFYIKNEVLHLDDLEGRSAADLEGALQRVQAIRSVGARVIAWLAQAEDFQKKLYRKLKFVVSSELIVSLDLLPPDLVAEALSSPAQRQVWADDFKATVTGSPTEAVATHPGLPVDTRLHPPSFRLRLLETLGERRDGVLINGDNAQALQLCRRRYQRALDCVYLDPPYNTSEETFVYKNEYKHSSWLTMMGQRAGEAFDLLADHGVALLTIDDAEFARLKLLLDGLVGPDRFIGAIAVQTNPRGRGTNSHFATSHDYILAYAPNPEVVRIVDQPLTEAQKAGYAHGDDDGAYRLLPFRRSGGLSTPDERPNSEFSLWYDPGQDQIVAVGGERAEPYPAPYVEREVLRLSGDALERLSLEAARAALPDDVIRILPVDNKGQRRVWRWAAREKLLRAARAGDTVVKQTRDGDFSVQLKDFIKAGRKPKTVWADSKYDGSSHGTNLLTDILGQRRAFGYPKSIHATRDALHAVVGDTQDAIVADFFGGSGTTGHAVFQLNEADQGQRTFILVEMGEYFETVTVPRVVRAAYSDSWSAGAPTDTRGISYALSLLSLESYDDTLESVGLQRDAAVDTLMADNPALREDYMLRYMLDSESGTSLLNLNRFRKPWNYTIKVRRDGVVVDTPVDLVETFNYLLGLRVTGYDSRGEQGLLFVQGTAPDGRRVLVVWRDCDQWSNARLEAIFREALDAMEAEGLDEVYVNGDNHLPALKQDAETWTVQQVEETFHSRMFRAGERG